MVAHVIPPIVLIVTLIHILRTPIVLPLNAGVVTAIHHVTHTLCVLPPIIPSIVILLLEHGILFVVVRVLYHTWRAWHVLTLPILIEVRLSTRDCLIRKMYLTVEA